jgi:ribosomal protein L24
VPWERSLAAIAPEVAAQWHPTKNVDVTPASILSGTSKKFWWNCNEGPDHVWEARVNDRVGIGNQKGTGCPSCSNRQVSVTNSLSTIAPEVAAQWHLTKNGDLTPSDIVSGTPKEYWWSCNAGHEWEARVDRRVSKDTDCPSCRRSLLTMSFAAVCPSAAACWDADLNGCNPATVVASSAKKYWFILPELGYVRRSLSSFTREGVWEKKVAAVAPKDFRVVQDAEVADKVLVTYEAGQPTLEAGLELEMTENSEIGLQNEVVQTTATDSNVKVGTIVTVYAGNHKGRTGTVTQVGPKQVVLASEGSDDISVRRSSLVPTEGNSEKLQVVYPVGAWVTVYAGRDKGRSGTITKATGKTATIASEGMEDIVVKQTSLRPRFEAGQEVAKFALSPSALSFPLHSLTPDPLLTPTPSPDWALPGRCLGDLPCGQLQGP